MVAGRADVLLSCSGDPGGDLDDRGFYIPSYPGNSLDSARLVFSTFDPGTYTMILTARKGTYDGPILGSDSATVVMLGAYPQSVATTFTFPSVRVAEGSRVCFILSRRSGTGRVYFSVAPLSGGCTSVIETDGTTPPLDTFRRNGVILVADGQTIRRISDAGGESSPVTTLDASLQEVYAAMFITASPAPVKAALKMQGHDTGPLRLPLVECDETERTAIHDVLARHGLLAGVTTG